MTGDRTEESATPEAGRWDADRTEKLFARLHEDPSARDALIEMYGPLARYLARRFEGRREPLDDLIQVAMLALVKSVDRFDPTRDIRFTTYASATIVGELKRHFRDRGWAIRVPRRLQETGLMVGRAVATMSQDLGRSPTVRELAERTSLSDEEVIEAMDAMAAYSTHSLDAPVDENGTTALDRLRDDDDRLETVVGWATVAPAIRALPARERRILYLRFFHGRTQSEIAAELGISQMHVSRLLTRSLEQLRTAARQSDGSDGPGGADAVPEDGTPG